MVGGGIPPNPPPSLATYVSLTSSCPPGPSSWPPGVSSRPSRPRRSWRSRTPWRGPPPDKTAEQTIRVWQTVFASKCRSCFFIFFYHGELGPLVQQVFLQGVLNWRWWKKTHFDLLQVLSDKNKNRLCSKTCGMDMNAERRKIWKNMKNQRKRWSKAQKDMKIFKMKFWGIRKKVILEVEKPVSVKLRKTIKSFLAIFGKTGGHKGLKFGTVSFLTRIYNFVFIKKIVGDCLDNNRKMSTNITTTTRTRRRTPQSSPRPARLRRR